MYQNLKSEIKDIIEIVNQCPDEFKGKCFELLLDNYLSNCTKSETSNEMNHIMQTNKTDEKPDDVESKFEGDLYRTNDDLTEKDFHVKTQKLLKDNNVTMQCINNLYYKENNSIKPFYDSLKTTNMSECQIRLSLLTAFENSFASGNAEMTFNCEVIRERCQAMKCYNAANFASIFKHNKSLWETWPEKYNKDFTVTLSSEGKKKLTEVLIALAEE